MERITALPLLKKQSPPKQGGLCKQLGNRSCPTRVDQNLKVVLIRPLMALSLLSPRWRVRERSTQVVDGRGNRDVVGDLELVEEFPGVASHP